MPPPPEPSGTMGACASKQAAREASGGAQAFAPPEGAKPGKPVRDLNMPRNSITGGLENIYKVKRVLGAGACCMCCWHALGAEGREARAERAGCDFATRQRWRGHEGCWFAL